MPVVPYDQGILYDSPFSYDYFPHTPIVVTIGAIDRSIVTEARSFQIDQVLTRRGDSAKVTILDTGNTLSIARFASLLVQDDVGNTLFKGWVTKQRIRPISATQRQIDLTGQDATIFLVGRGANKVYTNQYVTDIARDLVLNARPSVGITCTNTPAASGPQITFSVSHATIASSLDRLAKLASTALSTTGGGVYDWYVDYNQDLHFFVASAAPTSTVVLTDVAPTGTQLNYNRDSFYYEIDDTQLGNSVLVAGAELLSVPISDTFTGDGVATAFGLSQSPDTNAGGLPTVTVNGVSQTVALVGGSPPTTQWTVSAPGPGLRGILYVGTASVPSPGAAIVCTYSYDVPAFSRMTNAADIAALGTLPNVGTFERLVLDTGITSQTAAIARANAELAAYGQSYKNIQVETQLVQTGAVLGDLTAGKQVRIINSQLGVDLTMLVIKLTMRSKGPMSYYYALTLQAIS